MKTIFHWKFLVLLLSALFFHNVLQAQDLIGYNYNNYIGVNGIVSNPASIAASRYKFQFNLFTVNAYGGNNAYKINSKDFFRFRFDNMQEGKGYQKISADTKKYAWANTDILGPSFLLNLNKRSAIGLTTRFRTLFNTENVSNNIFSLIGEPVSSAFGMDFNEHNVKLNFSSFADAGITYARVIQDGTRNFLKAGITVKYIKGISAGSVRIADAQLNILNEDYIQKLNGNGSIQYADNLDRLLSANSDVRLKDELKAAASTIGMDLGFVYELRSGKFTQADNSKQPKNKTIPYNFRFSLAVTDLAFSPLHFKAGSESALYRLNGNMINKDTFYTKNVNDFEEYINGLENGNLLNKQASAQDYKMPLPTSLRANIDWHAAKRIFVNADMLWSLRGAGSEQTGAHYISYFSLTPRFETKWFSLFSPLSFNVRNELNWGAGFRLGPLFAGSGSVLSNLVKTNMRNADAYVGLNIPIYQGSHKKKKKETPVPTPPPAPKPVTAPLLPKPNPEKPAIQDRDKDGIADDMDSCPDVPGVSKYNGCPVPDQDKDGIPDEKDKCPLAAGTAANHGCPEIKPEIRKKVDTTAHQLYFVSGKATIMPASYKAMNELAAILKSDQTLHLEIDGHTDNTGKAESNIKLSQQRADAAKTYLVNKGIAADRISTQGFGSTRPIASNKTKEGRAKNRRIEMKLSNY